MKKKNDDSKEKKDLEPVSMGVIETPDTAATAPVGSPDGTAPDVAGPPADGEGCEGVTVIVAATQDRHPEYADITARSVKQNLMGVDARVVVMRYNREMTLGQQLLLMLDYVGTERIVLMTDEMVLLNPTTLYELGCRRGELTEKGVTVGECRTPKLMHKSVLLKMLPEMIATYALFNPLLEYDEYARPQVMPVVMRQWNLDNWLLPVVSASPSMDAIRQWAKTQRFMFNCRSEWPRQVVKFLEERFPA